MKKRWLVGLAVFLLAGALLLPQLAADMDFFFSRQFEKLTMDPRQGWTAVLGGGKALQFYFLLAAAVALLLVWVLFTSSYLNYRSKMWEVTPDIVTPCAAGQGQFGTARWLRPEKMGKYFGIWKVPREDAAFLELIAAGEADRESVRKANV